MAKKELTEGKPNYWVLVLANKSQRNKNHNAQVVFDAQLKRKSWGLNLNSKNFKNLRGGDIVLLYIGSPYCAFAGCAVVAESAREFTTTEQKKKVNYKYPLKTKRGVKFARSKRFNIQVPAPLAAPELKFIKKKQNWGAYFQGAAIKISHTDYEAVLAIACMFNPSLRKQLQGKKIVRKNGLHLAEAGQLH